MNKVKTLQWLVGLLLILNVTTIISFVYNNQQKQADNEVMVLGSSNESRLNGRYFRQTLGFNNQQMEAFRQANRSFQPNANAIIFIIDSLKNDVFTELKKEKPDTSKLTSLSDCIGKQHTALKNVTNQFYLEIKEVCTTDQKLQLNEVFSPLFNNQQTVRRGMHRNRPDRTPCN